MVQKYQGVVCRRGTGVCDISRRIAEGVVCVGSKHGFVNECVCVCILKGADVSVVCVMF